MEHKITLDYNQKFSKKGFNIQIRSGTMDKTIIVIHIY